MKSWLRCVHGKTCEYPLMLPNFVKSAFGFNTVRGVCTENYPTAVTGCQHFKQGVLTHLISGTKGVDMVEGLFSVACMPWVIRVARYFPEILNLPRNYIQQKRGTFIRYMRLTDATLPVLMLKWCIKSPTWYGTGWRYLFNNWKCKNYTQSVLLGRWYRCSGFHNSMQTADLVSMDT